MAVLITNISEEAGEPQIDSDFIGGGNDVPVESRKLSSEGEVLQYTDS